MKISWDGIVLRDYQISDIEDEIRWTNTDTAWFYADTPWMTLDPVDPDGRGRLGRGVGRLAHGKDIPVGGRAVVVMGKDAGAFQLHAPDIVGGLLKKIDVVD